jgi:hypothetical protein
LLKEGGSFDTGERGWGMSPHGKKMIAPVVITIVFILYLLIYLVMLVREAFSEPLVILMGIPLVLLGIGSVYALYSRIKEIRSGEEDDLDNY